MRLTDDGGRAFPRRSLLRVARGAPPAGALALPYGAGHVFSRRTEATWQRSVSEADPDLTGEAFTANVGKMAEKYGPRGVRGLRRERASGACAGSGRPGCGSSGPGPSTGNYRSTTRSPRRTRP